MKRFVFLLAILTTLGSMWMHGVINVSAMDDHHAMTEPTCIAHCLAGMRVDTADDGVGAVTMLMVSSSVFVIALPVVVEVSPSIQSHHDPGRILTTIKRE